MSAVSRAHVASSILNEAQFDLPEFTGERTVYLICSTPRSGSTLLAFLLVRCKAMGVPHEYLNTTHIAPLARRLGLLNEGPGVALDAYLDTVLRRRTSANGVFGLKAHYDQLAPLLRAVSVSRLLEKARLIRIRRRDLIAQAVSYYRAAASGVWSTLHALPPDAIAAPAYDGAAIARRLKSIVAEEKAWETFFASRRAAPLEVWYEDLLAQTGAVCDTICRHVGVETAFAFDPAQAGPLRLPADGTQDWKQRFRDEHPGLPQRSGR